eukprot:jgi/Hompol1/6651/HPOL_005043-RA
MSERTQKLLMNPVIFGSLAAGLVAVAVALYALFYALYMPPLACSTPLFLLPQQLSLSQASVNSNSNVNASVNAIESAWLAGLDGFTGPTGSVNFTHVKQFQSALLKADNMYDFVLEMEVPDSDANFEVGNFAVAVAVRTGDGALLAASTRPALVVFKSPLLRLLTTLWRSGSLLLFAAPEQQRMRIPLLAAFRESPLLPAASASVALSDPRLQFYAARLVVEARFEGLRFFMFHWWFATAAFFVTMLVLIEVLLLVNFTNIIQDLLRPLDHSDLATINDLVAPLAPANQASQANASHQAAAASSAASWLSLFGTRSPSRPPPASHNPAASDTTPVVDVPDAAALLPSPPSTRSASNDTLVSDPSDSLDPSRTSHPHVVP